MRALGKGIRFHVSIMATILVLVLITTATTIVIVLAVSNQSVQSTAESLFDAAGRSARLQTESFLTEVRDRATITATIPSMTDPIEGFAQDHPALPYLRQVLEGSQHTYSVYVGRDNGDFLQFMRAVGSDAPPATEFIVRSINQTDGVRLQHWTYLDDDGALLGQERDEAPAYDPRERPWYVGATGSGATTLTDPYRFDALQELGITASRVLSDGTGVVGVDLTLTGLQDYVNEASVSASGGIALATREGERLAVSERIAPLLEDGISQGEVASRLSRMADSQGREWFLRSDPWTMESGDSWQVITAAPVSDFLGPFRALRGQIVLAVLILLLVSFPIIFLISRSLTRVLGILAEEAEKIRHFDFSPSEPISSSIVEFHQLADGFGEMKDALSQRTRDLNANMEQLAKIIELNIAISAENDINRLSELILTGARELAGADGGSLYLKNEQGTQLEFQIVLNQTLGFAQGGSSGDPITLPPVPLYSEDGSPNNNNVVTHAFHTGETFNIDDAYNAEQFDFSGTRRFDESSGYHSKSILTVPLKPRGSGIIGAMQLLNRIDPESGEIGTFSPEIQRFVEALSAGAATALYNRDLIESQKRLFDSMIRLIAGAIDAKSPYTGGHCARVPVLAMMLGKEAESVSDGPLAEFAFESDQDWRAFRIGAWLHDAGKVTTPDFVVDKSTKLETIYNRIHEIRTRFEVILRDARIARHEAVLGGAEAAEEDRKLAEIEAELTDDYAFVAECNLGGEFLSEEHVARLNRIAARTWMRHFDDTVGLSWEEANRVSEESLQAAQSLPVEEHLIADKPEQVIPRTSEFYKTYEGFGFTIPVPEALYNRGELYNLSISRGTLSTEERFKINEHVMQTIVMLEELPFPDALQRVPEYAGTHHEALNGTGYPRQLSGEELSVPARVMAIADIFEALTASDRPYKPAKPLSVAVDILSKFRDEGHIDPDLFKLFLTSGAYRQYAEQYLKPEQLDEVDISKYV
jgi:HD-GYP domain-containing protein (c-di-GMP phosphodiesterase class II)